MSGGQIGLSQAGAWNQSGLDVPSLHENTIDQTHLNMQTGLLNSTQCNQHLILRKTSNKQQTKSFYKMVPLCLFAAVWLLTPMLKHVWEPEWPFAGRSLEPIWT